jgi:hypothetical protein
MGVDLKKLGLASASFLLCLGLLGCSSPSVQDSSPVESSSAPSDPEQELRTLRQPFGLLIEKRDEVEGYSTFRHPSSPEYVNMEGVFPYIYWKTGQSPVVGLRFQYFGNDWIFFDEIILSIDGETTTLNPSHFDVNRNNNSENVWEWYTETLYSTDLIDRVADSKETIVRLKGDDGKKKDYVLSRSQLNAFGAVSRGFQYANLYWDTYGEMP